ncbi:M24 family metallopeptidase [Halovenus halobia]|uniref:M24 family metallopeptidase n=1 Tax=Halovenus halobia TaxID=3396622 RepID=UPI003F57492F
MNPDLTELDEYLDEAGVDGYLIDADSEDADQYYLSGFDAPDPFITLYDGEVHLLFTRSLEYGRAKKEARAATIERGSDYGYAEKAQEYGPTEARSRVLAAFCEEYGVESVATPPRFPLQTADGLREHGLTVTADESGAVTEVRATKTEEEIEHIREAQRANETAMARAEELISSAETNADGELVLDGEVLTSERVTEEIEITLLRQGCALDETIVACGADAADPHDRGSGPLLADEPIIIDIFPRNKASRYHADMTRTFCHGEASERLEEWFELTDRAREAAIEAVEPGIEADEVHAAACDVYEDADLPTLRTDPTTETGFIHSTGHGVGLDVHELPSVANSGEILEPGHIITIEPGLYDPEIGGVRIEDLLVVTEDGYENLTEYDIELTVG